MTTPSAKDGSAYNTIDYYSTASFELVCKAHQALSRQHRADELNAIEWYWKSDDIRELRDEHHRERVGLFVLHGGPLRAMPLPLLAICLDSQIKTYMDRDALGDSVRKSAREGTGERETAALRVARERELARRIGGKNLEISNLLVAMVECGGYVVSGMMVNPGKRNETVGAIMRSSSHRAGSIAALQAEYSLAPDDPFLAQKENALVDLIRYFRVPDYVLKRILPQKLQAKDSYRKIVHLIRVLAISESFAATRRWAERVGREITTGVCETPTPDVKSLFEGNRIKTPAGGELKIPHRVLTSGKGVELYPAAYQNRPEGETKLYTLYTFDFLELERLTRKYREEFLASLAGPAPAIGSVAGL